MSITSNPQIPEKFKQLASSWQGQEFPFDWRPIDPILPFSSAAKSPAQRVWLRAVDKLGDSQNAHCCVAAFASDFGSSRSSS